MIRLSPAHLRRGEAAVWGSQPENANATSKPRLRMRLLAWRPIDVGNLLGIASVELPIGLRLHEIAIIAGRDGKAPWAAMPTKAQLDSDHQQRIGADGKPLYSRVAEWKSRELSDRFSAAVVELVQAEHPGAFGDAA